MRKYTYDTSDHELIQHLLQNTPKKVLYNFVYYVFDYGQYHISLECVDEEAASQNSHDEAMIAKLSKKDEAYVPNEHTKVVCENKPIRNIHVVRTFLYFSTFKRFSKAEKIANRIGYRIKSLFKKKWDSMDNLMSKTTGVGYEYICHPESEEATNIDPQFANLIDVGLLIEIEDKYLRAFLEGNGSGFDDWEEKYLHEISYPAEDRELYEFIKIERN